MHEGSATFATDDAIQDIHTHEPYQESAGEEPDNSGMFEEDQNGLLADGDHIGNPTFGTSPPNQRVDVFAKVETIRDQ